MPFRDNVTSVHGAEYISISVNVDRALRRMHSSRCARQRRAPFRLRSVLPDCYWGVPAVGSRSIANRNTAGMSVKRDATPNQIADHALFRSFATRKSNAIAQNLPSCGNMLLFTRSTFARDVHVYRHCHLSVLYYTRRTRTNSFTLRK